VTKKKSSARLDREIAKALGKKSKLWVPEKATTPPRSRPHATAPAKETAAKEKVCRYCGQQLYWAPDGHFECGGEGEGACSFWSAIGDYDRAGRPADIESWLDGWIQRELGADWATMGWDRAKHAKAIRDYFKPRLSG
jgi:hypothetical protein